MRDLKSLFDPDQMLNPDVLINTNPKAHVTHVKSMAPVTPEVDQCIECGFCESKCPSRRLTLTPRQRIVVQREISRLQALGSPSPELEAALADFHYAGIDTCAADGLCATACPVGINTGEFIKSLRATAISYETSASWIAEHFALAERAVGWSVRVGHAAEKVIGVNGVRSISVAAERLTGTTLPKWNKSIPSNATLRAERSGSEVKTPLPSEKEFIYFPSCISRQLGKPNASMLLSEALVAVARRAGCSLWIPQDVAGTCCGMPFASKGYGAAYKTTLHKTLRKLWNWSEEGKYPIVVDTTSCTHTLRTCSDDLSEEDGEMWEGLTLLDSVEFLHDYALPHLDIRRLDENVILHPNCSARKLGLDNKLLSVAQTCARSATVPLHLGCCAFAGDRGLLFPELTASATAMESAEVNSREYDGYYSSNIPCEIGMTEGSGKDYLSIVYLVERAS
jgi:D-lactate dehydrogenase